MRRRLAGVAVVISALPLFFVAVVEQKAEAAGDPSTLIGRSVEAAATDLVENKEFNWRRRAQRIETPQA